MGARDGEVIVVVQAFRPAASGRPEDLRYLRSDFFPSS
jgi:hypothetical protein